MKWSFLFYTTFSASILGCQGIPSFFSDPEKQVKEPVPVPAIHKHEQIVDFGAKFANNFKVAPMDTCSKFNELYQQGDWRAGWILALQVTEGDNEQCLNIDEAINILTTLECENKIDPDLIWLNQYHLRLLQKLKQESKKVKQLKSVIRDNKKQLVDLEAEKQELADKLEALKAIETSIQKN